ncbi:non-ribosomal peptide synthetase [Photobacterium sp. TY1-4]|uniref:non-ribosomal peptide synthetase n=1 Tax=Photobacterium sp. TY1-4 TaxID=2899122 RepID=UPI0021C24BEA|nr:non-ribosomal peptide synthetase [Photobacterium sp. TY1-4]UXI00905.1 amino acid adenylation domain-containing protein [Photobacterium sp. TY1-4]
MRFDLLEAFAQQCAKRGDAVAIERGAQQLSYRELRQQSAAIAHFLQSRPGHVALYLDACPTLISSLLACLHTGHVFAPVHTELPDALATSMLAQIAPTCVVTTARHAERLGRMVAGMSCAPEIIVWDEWTPGLPPTEDDVLATPRSQDPCYIYFTSGSTGEPKGILGSYRGLSHFVMWQQQTFGIEAHHRVGQLTIPAFDPFLREVLLPLVAGAVLVMPTDRTLVLTDQLLTWINQAEISVLHMVPTLLRQRLLQADAPQPLSLEYLFLAGEPLRGSDLAAFYRSYGEERCQLVNLYGPTETTLAKVFKRLSPADSDADMVPIGMPLDEQVQVHVLDPQGRPCAEDEVGELVIETDLRSHGYLGLEAETQRCFRQSPPYYFTGDLGKRLPDGQLVCIGRKDNQIKIRGIRADLLGLERVVQQAPTVELCVLQVVDTGQPSARIRAFVVASRADGAQIAEFVSQRLNRALVPAEWVLVETLPTLPNGKVNRKALAGVVGTELQIDAYRVAETPQEQQILTVWQQVLGQDRIGMDDHFFRRGGHSLMLMTLKAALEQAFSVRLDVAALFAHLTPATQLAYLQTCHAAGSGEPDTPLRRVQPGDIGPVSVLQRNVILAHQFHQQDSSYNITRVVELDQVLNTERLQQAVDACVAHVAILRATFVIDDGTVLSRIQPEVSVPVEGGRLDESAQLRAQLARFVRPFVLEIAPLLRIGLWSVAGERTYLALDIHHSIADGISAAQLITMILARYQGDVADPMPWQYHDYIDYNRRQLAAREADNLAYWQQRLAAMPEPLQLSPGRERPGQFDGAGSTQLLQIDKALMGRLEQVARQQGCSLFALLFAAYALTLHRFSGQDDVIIGVPVAGRDLPEVVSMPGVFMRVLPFRSTSHAQATLAQYLTLIQQQLAEAVAHQDFAFEHLVDAVRAPRDPSRQPLFDTLFAMHDAIDLSDGGLQVREIQLHHRQVKADLIIDVYRYRDALTVACSFAEQMIAPNRVAQLLQSLSVLLQRLADMPLSQPLTQIDGIPAAERERLLHTLNQTAHPITGPGTLIERFHQQVDRAPMQQACRSQGQKLTYRALDERANQLAHGLLETLGQPQARVAIMVAPSADLAVAILAVLKAGMAYVPLDPDFPQERLQYMVANAGVACLITDQPEVAKSLFAGPIVSASPEAWADRPQSRPSVSYDPHHLAYVIYTSGSTGQPKGVMIENVSVVNFINGMARSLGEMTQKTVLVLTTFSFDIFVLEFFLPLLTGAQLVIASRRQQQDMSLLSALIRKEDITTLQFTPTRMKMFLAFDPTLQCFRGIREVLMGGEYVGFELVETIRNHSPARIFNVYGPTETTVWSTVCELTQADRSKVGRPIDNTLVYVLDQHRRLCPMGTQGELYIAGMGLARGYHRLPDKTAEAFVDNPFQPGQRMYRTGDLAYWLPSGELCIQGRLDHQVKVKGHRIELHEIESVLKRHPAVHDAVCLVRERQVQGFAEGFLCAFYQADSKVEAEQLRQHVRAHLPGYMVPEAWAQLADFPKTANGKIDRKHFPEIARDPAETGRTTAQSRTEERIYQVWAAILPTAEIGFTDNFFDLGGNSFHVVLVQKALADQDMHVSAIDILEHGSISRLAAWYDRASEASQSVRCYAMPFPEAPSVPASGRDTWEDDLGDASGPALEALRRQLDVSREELITGLLIYALGAVSGQTVLTLNISMTPDVCRLVRVDFTGVENLPAFFARVVDALATSPSHPFSQLSPDQEPGCYSIYLAADAHKSVVRGQLFDLELIYLWDDGLQLQARANHPQVCRDALTQVGQAMKGLVAQFAATASSTGE